jgi:hypothetical protein
VQFSCVDEVEYLQHHKDIEDNCEMPRIVASCLKCVFVIFITVQEEKPTAADRATHHAVPPSVLGVAQVGLHQIQVGSILGNESFTHKDQD